MSDHLIYINIDLFISWQTVNRYDVGVGSGDVLAFNRYHKKCHSFLFSSTYTCKVMRAHLVDITLGYSINIPH